MGAEPPPRTASGSRASFGGHHSNQSGSYGLVIAFDGDERCPNEIDATRATARLPGLDIKIVHRRSPSGHAEQISINLRALFRGVRPLGRERQPVRVLGADGAGGMASVACSRPGHAAIWHQMAPVCPSLGRTDHGLPQDQVSPVPNVDGRSIQEVARTHAAAPAFP
jgi:hypothetical protein